MSIVGDDGRLLIEMAGLAIAVGTIIWRTSGLTAKLEADGNQRREQVAEIKNTIGGRMDKVETRLDALQSILVSEARQDERIAAMDQRMLAQGARIDSTAGILNGHMDTIKGRLEAINNIVQGHTAQLNNLPRASKAG